MKNYITALLTILLVSLTVFGQAKSNHPESLEGAKAINQLRESGDYESLRAAFNTARGGDNEATGPEAYVTKLTASDSGTSDGFGISVAVSGDTAVIGAFGDNIGANNFQGSAYVFIKTGTECVRAIRASSSKSLKTIL